MFYFSRKTINTSFARLYYQISACNAAPLLICPFPWLFCFFSPTPKKEAKSRRIRWKNRIPSAGERHWNWVIITQIKNQLISLHSTHCVMIMSAILRSKNWTTRIFPPFLHNHRNEVLPKQKKVVLVKLYRIAFISQKKLPIRTRSLCMSSRMTSNWSRCIMIVRSILKFFELITNESHSSE